MKNTLCSTAYRSTGFVIALLLSLFALVPRTAHAQTTSTLVISQVYGGGGNASASYANDFIELFNPTNQTITITNWSVQYASSTGTSWSVTNIPSATILPGHYYLIQETAGGGGGTNTMPTPDISGGAINLGAANGKVALVSSTTALSGAAPTSATIVDVVGYGTGTNFSETAIIAPGPSDNIKAVMRNSNGCTDANNNSTDFTVVTANPRNSSSTANNCTVTNYYSKSSGALNTNTNWGTNTDGSGTAPSGFGISQAAFHIANGNTSLSSAWTVNGGGSSVVVDASQNLTVSASTTLTARVDVASGGTLTLTGSTAAMPTIGVISGTLHVNNSATTTLSSYFGNTYGNLTFDAATQAAITPLSGGATTITGNLTAASTYTTTLSLGANTVNLGGNFTWGSASGALSAASATMNFNGTAQTYSTSLAAGHTFGTTNLNSSTSLTASGKYQTGTFNWNSGTLTLSAGTTTAVGNTFSVTGTFASTTAKTLLGGGTLGDGTTNLNGGVLKLTGSGAGVTNGITIGNASSPYSSGILDLTNATAIQNVASNTITVNPYSQLYISTALTTSSLFPIVLNGPGNNISTTYGAGALKSAVTATMSNPITIATDATISAGGTTSLTLSGPITLTGQLTKRGSGLLIISGSSTSITGSGGFKLSEGTASVSSGSSLGGGPIEFAEVNAAGTATTLTLNTNLTTTQLKSSWEGTPTIKQTLNIASGSTLTLNQSTSTTFGGNGSNTSTQSIILGAGGINMTGGGTISLTSGGSLHSGAINLINGNMILAHGAITTLGLGGITVPTGSSLLVSASAATTLAGASGMTISGGSVTLSSTASNLIASGGTVTISGGNLAIASGNSSGTNTIGALNMTGGSVSIASPALTTITSGCTITNASIAVTSTAGTSLGATVLNTGAAITLTNSAPTTLGALTLNNGSSLVVNGSTTTVNTTIGNITGNGGSLLLAPVAGTAITLGTVTFNGSNLSTNGLTASGMVINGGAVTLSSNATITLDPNTVHTIKFAASNGSAWGSNTLTIRGWQGDYIGGTASKGKIIFLTGASTTLGGTNLNKVQFIDGSGNVFPAVAGPTTGEIVPKATITTGAVSFVTPPAYNDVDNNITVAYTYTGPAPTSVVVQLSDATGSFTNSPTTLVTTGTVSPVTATIPSLTPVGNGYKVRVIELAPVNSVTGTASTNSISIIGHPPIVTSITPTKAVAGATITITGSNFNTTNTNNLVTFGDVSTTAATASFNTLTVTVPTGASLDFVTVEDITTHLVANTPQKFQPDYTNDYFTTALGIQPAVSFSTHLSTNDHYPWNSAFGDLDGDGKMDMVVCTGDFISTFTGDVEVYRNTGAGPTSDFTNSGTPTFTHVGSPISVQGIPSSIKIADMDGDGKPDVVVAGGSGFGTITFLHNNTTGYGTGTPGPITFQASPGAQVSIYPAVGPRVLNIADYDLDGKPDVAAACYRGTFGGSNIDTLIILINNTSYGSNFSGTSFTPYGVAGLANSDSTDGVSLTSGDFDGDGKIDIAMTNQIKPTAGNSNVVVFQNNSTGGSISFSQATTLTAQHKIQDITSADFDGDGKIDLAVTNQFSSNITVYTNGSSGSGNFSFPTTYSLPGTTGWAPTALTSGDMNGDGLPDIILTNANSLASVSDTVAVFLNTTSGGTLSFANPQVFDNGSPLVSAGVQVADLDGDKYPDIIVSNLLGDQVSILRNKPTLNIGHINGTSVICHNTSTTLTYSTTGTTNPAGGSPAYADNPLPSDLSYAWSSTNGSAGTIDATTGVFGATGSDTVSGVFTLSVTGTNITASVLKPVGIQYVAINNLTDPVACQGDTSSALTYVDTSGSPITYSLAFDAAGTSAGFADVTNATLTSPIHIHVPNSVPFSLYPINVTVSDGTCTSDPATVFMNVSETPTASITGNAASLCVNRLAQISFAGTVLSDITYTANGVTQSATLTDGTDTISIPHIQSTEQYVLVTVTNGTCTSELNDTVTITAIPQVWTGTTSTNWFVTTNWTCGLVPTDSDKVTIPVTPNQPDLAASSTGTSMNLILEAGAAITLNTSSVLNVKGDFTNNGTVKGAGEIALTGSSAQTIYGTGMVSNIELNNGAGATIDTGDHMTISTALTVTSGTLTTNDSLELYSDSNYTARVASLPSSGASISGKVKTDQYIQDNYRRYRFWSHAFSTPISLGQLQPYMDITGSGGSANGFTTTTTNNPSCFRLVPKYENDTLSYDPGWIPVTQINGAESDTNKLNPGQGVRLFFRGAKGEGLNGWTYHPSANTVAMKGTLNQGDQILTLSQGTGNPAHQSYNMVGNPYASPVELCSALAAASDSGWITGTAFYVWNASLGAAGQYQAVTIDPMAPYYLPAYACFQVKAAYNGAHIRFYESQKGAAANDYLFKPAAAADQVMLNVYDANYHLWDMLTIRFNDNATDGNDIRLDATKPAGPDFNFYSWSSDHEKMVIDTRPFASEKVIPLGVSSQYKQDFIIRADKVAMPAGGTLYLHDKLMNKYVELAAGAEYRFTIGADKNTQGNERFELSMKPANVAADKFTVVMTPNPTSEDVKIRFTSPAADKVTLRITDMSGVSVYTSDLGNKQSGVVTVPVARLAPGIYMVELASGNNKSVQKLVKE